MDPTAEYNALMNALHVKNWYAVAALVMALAIQFFRKHPLTAATWQKIPQGWRFLPAFIGGFAVAFVQAFMDKQPFGAAVLAGLGGIGAIAFPAMGIAAALKESPLPWDGGAGGKLALILMLIVAPPMLTSCLPPCGAASPAATKSVNLAYSSADTAFELLSRYESAKDTALLAAGPLTPDAAALKDARTDRLNRIREALSLAFQAIQAAKSADAWKAIDDAIALLKVGLEEAKADGADIPDAVLAALDAAIAIVGGC